MKHVLTVTIPSYRQPVLLRRTLLGLAHQTYKDFNVVILDDKSGLDFTEIRNEFSEKLNLSVITYEKNIGAMNNLLASILFECESKYILSLHEDDYLKTNYLEVAVSVLEKNDNIAFVLTSPLWITKKSSYEASSISDTSFVTFNEQEFMIESLKRTPFIFGSVVYRRSDLTVRSFDMDTYHTMCDKIFMTELLRKDKLAGYIKEAGILVQDHNLDGPNPRPNGQVVGHVVNFYSFYKKHIKKEGKEKDSLITNSFLLGCACMHTAVSFKEIYEAQKEVNLISFKDINKIGVYAIIRIAINKKLYQYVIKLASYYKLKK